MVSPPLKKQWKNFLTVFILEIAFGSGNLLSIENAQNAANWHSRPDLLVKALAVDARDAPSIMEELARNNWNIHKSGSGSLNGFESDDLTALLCVPLAAASRAATELVESPTQSSDDAHSTTILKGARVAYTSKSEDAACFVVHDSSERIQVCETRLLRGPPTK
jgi:hypothetical protein